jgi:hypothetical protein
MTSLLVTFLTIDNTTQRSVTTKTKHYKRKSQVRDYQARCLCLLNTGVAMTVQCAHCDANEQDDRVYARKMREAGVHQHLLHELACCTPINERRGSADDGS